ncbi:MAG: hypothetical protein Tsb007_15060 [Rhizobacter sp.]
MIQRHLRNLVWLACLTATGAAHADYVSDLGAINAPAAIAFSNSTDTHLSMGTIVAPLYNFRDRWAFTLGDNANLTSLVATFSFADTFGINNIQVNLLNAAGVVALGWQNVVMNGPVTTTVSITPTAGLTAGDYTLQVRGLLLNPPAAYAGSLIASAPTLVPLPAALPMLLLGLGALGAIARQCKRR